MNVQSYTLTFETSDHEYSIMYLGNENVVIECTTFAKDKTDKIVIPRILFEKFIEIIK